jgi:hypothetical protein
MRPNTAPNTSWTDALRFALQSGTVASVLSSAVLASRGAIERHDPAGPMNGPSQWIWGLGAPYVRGFSFRHTVLGYLIHHASSILWAAMFEKAAARRAARPAVETLALAGATAVVASIVDFKLVPRRLTPGFEKRLSRQSLVLTYGAFALALAGAVLLTRKRS